MSPARRTRPRSRPTWQGRAAAPGGARLLLRHQRPRATGAARRCSSPPTPSATTRTPTTGRTWAGWSTPPPRWCRPAPTSRTPAPRGPRWRTSAGLDGQLHALYVSGGARLHRPRRRRSASPTRTPARPSPRLAARFAGGATPRHGHRAVGLPAGHRSCPAARATTRGWTRRRWFTTSSWTSPAPASASGTPCWWSSWETPAASCSPSTSPTRSSRCCSGTWWAATIRSAITRRSPSALAAGCTGGGAAFSGRRTRSSSRRISRIPAASPPACTTTADLGGARGLAIGQLRQGLEPVYAVFAASSSRGPGRAGQGAGGVRHRGGHRPEAVAVGAAVRGRRASTTPCRRCPRCARARTASAASTAATWRAASGSWTG